MRWNDTYGAIYHFRCGLSWNQQKQTLVSSAWAVRDTAHECSAYYGPCFHCLLERRLSRIQSRLHVHCFSLRRCICILVVVVEDVRPCKWQFQRKIKSYSLR